MAKGAAGGSVPHRGPGESSTRRASSTSWRRDSSRWPTTAGAAGAGGIHDDRLPPHGALPSTGQPVPSTATPTGWSSDLPGERGADRVEGSDDDDGLAADELFAAFFTTKPQGTGMGVTISRSIIESHGGRLWATSKDGRGASFHFALPAAESSPEGVRARTAGVDTESRG